LVVLDKLLLFVAFGFEKKARDLVVAAADALQQALGAAERISDLESPLKVILDLASAVEFAGFDFRLELFDLSGSEVACVPLVMEDQQVVETLVAEDAEPIANGASGGAKQSRDFLDGFAFVDPKYRKETLLHFGVNVGAQQVVDATSQPFVPPQQNAWVSFGWGSFPSL
jgi:hypothetical protein